MGTAVQSGGVTTTQATIPAGAKSDADPISGSAFFAGAQLNHEQISLATMGGMRVMNVGGGDGGGGSPYVGLPANMNPWPDVYFVSKCFLTDLPGC